MLKQGICDFCGLKKPKIKGYISKLMTNKILNLCQECSKKKDTQEFCSKFQEVSRSRW